MAQGGQFPLSFDILTLNSDPNGPLQGSFAYRKAALHEIGHLLGLADNRRLIGGELIEGRNGSSVMNYWSPGKDDPEGSGSWMVTACDRDAARVAPFRQWP